MTDKCYSLTGEDFWTDDFTDLDIDIGSTYYVGTTVSINPKDLVYKWVVDDILERMDEALYEEVGEVAEGNLHLSEEHNNQLTEIIKTFMEEHAKVTCFKVVDIKERTFNGEIG